MLIKINGRQHFLNRNVELTKDRPGYYTAKVNGDTFKIFGGKHSGGASNEWFVENPDLSECIYCDSLIDGLRLITETSKNQ